MVRLTYSPKVYKFHSIHCLLLINSIIINKRLQIIKYLEQNGNDWILQANTNKVVLISDVKLVYSRLLLDKSPFVIIFFPFLILSVVSWVLKQVWVQATIVPGINFYKTDIVKKILPLKVDDFSQICPKIMKLEIKQFSFWFLWVCSRWISSRG